MNGLAELRRRYPWPDTIPDVAPDEHGWFQSCNARLLKRVLGPQTKLLVELGSWLGKSARFMLRAAPGATIICIDHWRGSAEHHAPRRQDVNDKLPRLYETFLRNMWPWRDRVVPLRGDTVAGLRELGRLHLAPDLVYIDAGHDYENVRADLRTALELFPAARIAGDDWIYFEGVRRAVGELAEARGLKIVCEENAWIMP